MLLIVAVVRCSSLYLLLRIDLDTIRQRLEDVRRTASAIDLVFQSRALSAASVGDWTTAGLLRLNSTSLSTTSFFISRSALDLLGRISASCSSNSIFAISKPSRYEPPP